MSEHFVVLSALAPDRPGLVAELTAYFDKSKEKYRIGEKRRIKYALLNVDQVRQTIKVPEADIEAFYKQG